MTGPVILDLHTALTEMSAVSASAPSIDSSHAPDHVSKRPVERDSIQLYALTRAASGALVMGHVSHSSHSSHSSGSSHYSHGSHASHSSHSSHVSGAHSSHVSSVATPPSGSHGGSTATNDSSSQAAKGRPDLRIGKKNGALVGNNIYGAVKRQTIAQTGTPGKKLTFRISVQNDAKVSDRIQLAGTESGSGFSVKYIAANGVDVTRQVSAGTFRTPRLKPGATYRLKVVVKVTRQATAGEPLPGTVSASSVLTPARTDAVEFVAYRR